MEGLATAASVIAVGSISIQLTDSVKKLCDFWDSVKDAPEDIASISTDLHVLSGVLSKIAFEAQQVSPNENLISALKGCCVKVDFLTKLLNQLEPGFASRKRYVRRWTAVKAASRSGQLKKLKKFQDALERTKTTLSLVQGLQTG